MVNKAFISPSSCKKQINKHNSYLLLALLQSGSVPELDMHVSKHVLPGQFIHSDIVMNKGEINTGESNENESVHKFNESVVSKNCCFKVKLYLFEWFVIIECERTDNYANLFTKKLSTRNSLNYIHNDRYCNRKKAFTFFREMLNNYLAIRQMLNLLC
jgi:hypothetical protein